MQKNKNMKKKNYFLSALLVIFLVGILLTIAGVCSGGRLFSYRVDSEDVAASEMTFGSTIISDTDAKNIIGLDFDFKAHSAKIVEGNQYCVESNGQYESYVKDGVWHIETRYPKAHFTFLSHKIEIPAFWNGWDEDEKEFIITIPDEAHFTTADIKLAAGNLNGDILTADNITFKVGAGELDFKKLVAKELNTKVGAGEATFREFLIEESCDIDVGAGEISFGSEDSILGENIITNLNGKCAAGEIYIAGRLLGDADLDCSTGEIDLLLDGCRNNYNMNTSGALTEINIDDPSASHNHSSSNENDLIKCKEQYADIALDCSLGEINVEFEE